MDDSDDEDDGADMPEVKAANDLAVASDTARYQAANAKREAIAQEIWTEYRKQRAARGDPIP